ncbi:MAG: hypothetical protein HKM04_11040 [Legionellales bacterium]|nr:hypothetical protein [Legionellales bacterium]
MAFIILRLLDDTENIEFVLGGELHSPIISKIVTLNEAIAAAKDKIVFLLVPGMDVISFEKTLPKMSMSKLIKALPYAIEDQLLESIDHYHVVIGHLAADGRVDALVTPHRNMEAWLAPFQKQLVFESMLPDYFLLPYESGVWHVAIEKNVLIRTGLYKGLSCDRENWLQILQILWQESSEASRPTKLIVHQYGDQPFPDASEFDALPITVEKQKESGTLLTTMAEHFEQNRPSGNLLQDKFAQEHHLIPMKKTALITLGMFATALFISLLGTIIQYVALDRQDNFLQTQITALYKQIYPAATSVVAPKIRIQSTLNELQANQAGNGYLGVLMLTAQVLKQLPAIQVMSLRYQDNQLVIELQANNFKSLDLALSQLNKNNLIAKQDQGATKGNQVVARFTIREKT